MDYREMFDSPFVTAFDLKGGDVLIDVIRVEKQSIKSSKGEDAKPVVFCKQFAKGIVFNKTNSKRTAALYGNDTANWIGKQLTLYPSEVEVEGDTKPCIRVRPQAPALAAPQIAKTA